MKITNAEVLNLYNALSNTDLSGNAKFVYTLAKNRALLKPLVDTLQEVTTSYAKENPRVKEFQEKGEELLKKFAVTEDGSPAVRQAQDGNSFQRIIPAAKQSEFIKARLALDEAYKDVNLGFELRQREFAEILKEEVDVPLRMLKLKDVPEGGLKTSVMNQIFIFVDDTEDSKGEVMELRPVK